MPNLLPYKSYSEYDVINLYACQEEASKGTIVGPVISPDKNPIELTSFSPGAKYNNIIADQFELIGKVTPLTNYNEIPIGILLYDVMETDENGEKLIFNPRKMAEKNVVLPNIHAAPILTKGIVLINDIDTSSHTPAGGGSPAIGDAAWVGSNGRIGTDGIINIGKFLSTIDSNGYALVKINF